MQTVVIDIWMAAVQSGKFSVLFEWMERSIALMMMMIVVVLLLLQVLRQNWIFDAYMNTQFLFTNAPPPVLFRIWDGSNTLFINKIYT